jgi:uncharacterized protein (DUF2141 family)
VLFFNSVNFPNKILKSVPKIIITQINGTDPSFDFLVMILEKYAICVIHDENRNGDLHSNMFGIPKKDYHFFSVTKVT